MHTMRCTWEEASLESYVYLTVSMNLFPTLFMSKPFHIYIYIWANIYNNTNKHIQFNVQQI